MGLEDAIERERQQQIAEESDLASKAQALQADDRRIMAAVAPVTREFISIAMQRMPPLPVGYFDPGYEGYPKDWNDMGVKGWPLDTLGRSIPSYRRADLAILTDGRWVRVAGEGTIHAKGIFRATPSQPVILSYTWGSDGNSKGCKNLLSEVRSISLDFGENYPLWGHCDFRPQRAFEVDAHGRPVLGTQAEVTDLEEILAKALLSERYQPPRQ